MHVSGDEKQGYFDVSNNTMTAFPTHTIKFSLPLTTVCGRGITEILCYSRLIVEWAIQSALVEVVAGSCEYFVVADLAAVSVLV